jgi:hypothetical protein
MLPYLKIQSLIAIILLPYLIPIEPSKVITTTRT